MTGLVFGTFDPLHAGHVRLLRACRDQCDRLTVVVHADEHVRREKGRTPAPVAERVADVAELRAADRVLPGTWRTKAEAIAELRPDVVFVGEETTVWGWETRTVVMPRTPGISSTMLREGWGR